jgi:hypothetical protein
LCDAEGGANPAARGLGSSSKQREGDLRDKMLTVGGQQRDAVTPKIDATIEKIKATVFAIHGF